MLPGVVLTGGFSPLAGKLCDQFNPRFLLVARLSSGGSVRLLVRHHGGADRGAHADLGAGRARRPRVGLPALSHVGVAHAGARGDQCRLGFTEYHPTNCRHGRHCAGGSAPRTLALRAPPHRGGASRRLDGRSGAGAGAHCVVTARRQATWGISCTSKSRQC